MAVPQLFRVLPLGAALTDPVAGPTAGGNLVELYGDGFQLPSAAPASPSGDDLPPPTVEVLFDGVPSPRVDVIRSNFIRAVAPGSPLQQVSAAGISSPEGSVSITIRNVDATGAVIAGETLTVPDAYSYVRAGITAVDTSTLKYIDREFVLRWRRDTIENVLKGEHTEWDPDTSDDLNVISIAQMPAIVLVGPDQPENKFYSLRELQEQDLGNGQTALTRPPRTVDLVYDVLIITDNEGQLMALAEMVRSFIKNMPFFEIARCPTDSSLGTVRYEVDEVDFDMTKQNRPNNSNTRSYTLTVAIKGVDLGLSPGFGDILTGAETAVPVLDDLPILDAEAYKV